MKAEWPDLSFGPVNLWVVMSAADFKQLVKDYGISDLRRRNHYFFEGESVLTSEQVMPIRFTDPKWKKPTL